VVISILLHAVNLQYHIPEQRDNGQRCSVVSGPTLWNLVPLTIRDPSLTLTQFYARLKTVRFCRAYETLAKRLCDSLGCKDCCANTNSLTYLLYIENEGRVLILRLKEGFGPLLSLLR